MTIVYFIKLKVRGLGYRIRKISELFYYFFFNYTNYFYLYLPINVFIKVYKKRAIFVGYNWQYLKQILSNILLLKKLGPYSLRGLRLVKQIVLLKKSGKNV